MSRYSFPYETHALRVDQRLGTFYIAVLPAELLLEVAISDVARATINPDGSGYQLDGAQRFIQDKRLNEIAHYINRTDASFPNSIIIAANFDINSGFDQDEIDHISNKESGDPIEIKSKSWTVTELEDGSHRLEIPTREKIAAIIDGQHRLFSFAKADPEAMRSMNLPCAIFIDLPKPLQAQIFATINSNQKRVDRSLTYELFGYNVSDEEEEYWTPDKLAVFLTRKLGTDEASPLRRRIMVAPKKDTVLFELTSQADWRVSTAVVVDGILRLISSNPKRDSNIMRKSSAHPREILRSDAKDKSPLREAFINGDDILIYKMLVNYLAACNRVFWNNANPDSFIFRTIGVQAILDILRKLANESYLDRDISENYFYNKIRQASDIDFSDDKFRNPSGSGRTLIRKTIEEVIGISP